MYMLIFILVLLYALFRIKSTLSLNKKRKNYIRKHNRLIFLFNRRGLIISLLEAKIDRHEREMVVLSNKVAAFEILKKAKKIKKTKIKKTNES